MLVLSRKINERIMIGDNIELEILEIRGGVVRLGIRAPREIAVIRSELREQLDAVKREWAVTPPLSCTARSEIFESCAI